MPHGGAEQVSLIANESPILSDEEKMYNIIHVHVPSIHDGWRAKWLPAIDCLDPGILVDYPGLCHRLVTKSIKSRSWPRDINSHVGGPPGLVRGFHPLGRECAVSFIQRLTQRDGAPASHLMALN